VRTIRVVTAPEEVLFPYVAQAFLIECKITQAQSFVSWTK
jgi:hypothetical protein